MQSTLSLHKDLRGYELLQPQKLREDERRRTFSLKYTTITFFQTLIYRVSFKK